MSESREKPWSFSQAQDKEKIEKWNPAISIIGVNNRNLKTFEVSLDTSLTLAENIPDQLVKVSESGISSAADITLLAKAGYQGFLIGATFADAPTADDAGDQHRRDRSTDEQTEQREGHGDRRPGGHRSGRLPPNAGR